MRTPPTIASALLTRFGQPNAAFVGDLLEQFQAGKSRVWFWRQVIETIVATTVGDVREHPYLASRAIIVGHASAWVIARYAMFDLLHYDEWLFSRGLVGWFYLNGYGFPEWSLWPALGLLFAVSGWIVARTHRRAPPGILVVYALSVASLHLGFGLWRLAHPLPAQAHLVGVRECVPLAVCAFLGGMMGQQEHQFERRV